MTLLDSVRAKPSLRAGMIRVPIPVDTIDLRTGAALHLLDRGFTSEPLPFETVHERLAPSLDADDPGLAGILSTRLCGGPAELRAAYLELVAFLARDILGFDVVFEADPALRFYVPGPMPDRYRARDDRQLLTFHSDLMLGDHFEQFNCWLPLGRCAGTCALQMLPFDDSVAVLERFIVGEELDATGLALSRERFFELLDTDAELRERVCASARPLVTRYGELVVFDPRLVHGTAENREVHTRVSIDFRLLPKAAYDAHEAKVAAGIEPRRHFDGQPLAQGHYYDARTAFEL